MPVSSAGKVATANVEPVVFVSEAWISKLSTLFGSLMRTKFVPGTDARVIRPSGAERLPVLTTVPPSKVKFPDVTVKFAVLIIAPA
jgi:hypothetical protein